MKQQVKDLLAESGRTFAEDAGIELRNGPATLYRLLVLSTLLSARIRHEAAIDAAKELFAAGYDRPEHMRAASWQDLVDALGRGGYRRYDESTATALGEGAKLVIDRWDGDLRHLRAEAEQRRDRIENLLQEVPRIGPAGAAIFCREAQGVWPELRPYLDERALDGAKKAGLPADADKLAALVDGEDLPRLAAALVRTSLEH
jgi:endonuclease III